nr:DoxX family protein [uncultured Flavobacterium sp.]
MELPFHLYVMAGLYILAGLNHFRTPKMYYKIIPPFLGNKKAINSISGAAEIILGTALCIPSVSSYAAWGIIVMLIAVFPANIYMFQNEEASLGLPKWARLLRLPLQLFLIWWAYLYT